MIFACQKDSLLQELETVVVSCEPKTFQAESTHDDKVQSLSGFEVVFEDTVLFPEGGGQPSDTGVIDGKYAVLHVSRTPTVQAAHFIQSDTPFAVGQKVHMKVDWCRRLYHMTQHSAQHLITAVASEQPFGFPTVSWHLGKRTSYIELNAKPELVEKMRLDLENRVNQLIGEDRPVVVKVFNHDSPEVANVRKHIKFKEAVSESLEHDPLIRVVCIEGVDENTCCGTHVPSLGFIRVIKLLYTEKGKQGKSILHFVAGDVSVRLEFESYIVRERALTNVLKCRAEDHVDKLNKLNASFKQSNKHLLSTLRDLAILEAKMFNLTINDQNAGNANVTSSYRVYAMHRTEADAEYMIIFANEVKPPSNVVLFLSTGDCKSGQGQIVLANCPQQILDEVCSEICQILDGKGFAKHGRYQAKVAKLNKKEEAIAALELRFKSYVPL